MICTFIKNGHREVREPIGHESRQIKASLLSFFKQRGLYVKGIHRLPCDVLASRALDYTDELRLPMIESCVFIRRAR